MRWAHLVVNGLVIGFASFFAILGVIFLLIPVTGRADAIEGGAGWDKAILGVIFLLAAAPMYYYVFSRSAHAMPPPVKRPKASAPPPPPPPAAGKQF